MFPMFPINRVILAFVVFTAFVAVAGCQSNGQPDCTRIRAAYTQAEAVVTSAQNAVAAQEAVINALPPNDPIRQQLGPALAKAQAYLAETQVLAEIAGASVAALCPAIPTPPLSPAASARWNAMRTKIPSK